MPALLEDPVQHLLGLLRSQPPRRIIGLIGVPGSGKSTWAMRLTEEVNARSSANSMMALSMDGFHLTRAELRQFPDPVQAFARRGAPWTFDVRAFAQHVQALRAVAGQTVVTWPAFEHAVGDPLQDALCVPASTGLVLIEGLYLLHQEHGWAGVRALFDEVWFLDTALELSLERLALRHMQAWGFTRAEAEERIANNDGLNAQIVLESAGLAQWRVEG